MGDAQLLEVPINTCFWLVRGMTNMSFERFMHVFTVEQVYNSPCFFIDTKPTRQHQMPLYLQLMLSRPHVVNTHKFPYFFLNKDVYVSNLTNIGLSIKGRFS